MNVRQLLSLAKKFKFKSVSKDNQLYMIQQFQKKIISSEKELESLLNKKSNNVDFNQIIINEESIKRKLKLAQRKKELPLRNYEIKKSHTVYDTKNQPNNNVLDFQEDILSKKPFVVQVEGLGNGYFSVNDQWYPGSIICFPRQVFLWDVANAGDIRAHTLDIVDIIKPKPNYIVIGTGKNKVNIPSQIYERFREKSINVDVLPTFEACSTFNVCADEDIQVIAFLIPNNL